jgi:glutamyl-tRNA reductase
MIRTLTVYEVEHPGDEAAALRALQRAGCTNIKVMGRDYEGAEAIAVQFEHPAVDVGEVRKALDEAEVIYH